MAKSSVFLIAALAVMTATPAQARKDASLETLLEAKTQALADAIASGDRATWLKSTNPSLLFVNENNQVITRDELMKQLEPLPKGLDGHIKVIDFQMQRHGDIAVTTYIADETLDYHGQLLKTRFRTIDSWQRQGTDWKMISSMTLAVLGDPPAIKLPVDVLKDYAGRYELTSDIHYVVRLEGDSILGQREGGKEVELKAEAPDLFFVPGSPRSRKVFYRDSAGRVVGFGDRREGQDIRWKRLP